MNTPETDKAAHEARTQTIGKWIVPIAKARKLETERNEARKQRDELMTELQYFANFHCYDNDCQCNNCRSHRLIQAIANVKGETA